MKVTMETRVTGTSHKISKQGKPYDVIGFLDGADVVQAMADEKVDVHGIRPFEPYVLTLDINMGRYMSVKVVEVKEVK